MMSNHLSKFVKICNTMALSRSGIELMYVENISFPPCPSSQLPSLQAHTVRNWVMYSFRHDLVAQLVKNLQWRRPRFDSWVGKIPWRRKWQPTSVFLPGESHGQRSLAGYRPWGCKSQTRLSDWTTTIHTEVVMMSLFHITCSML